jgi:type II restriction enzyme
MQWISVRVRKLGYSLGVGKKRMPDTLESLNEQLYAEEKMRLDQFIAKQRVALYKPIQIAEILHRVKEGTLTTEDLKSIEKYRNPSKRWRDIVTRRLIGQISTSSQKFQDNLFEPNAIPPTFLVQLAEINNQFAGMVERYIYQQFRQRQSSILKLIDYLTKISAKDFSLEQFLSEFRHEPGLRRSIDKAYEIVVYALFNALVKRLHVSVRITVDRPADDVFKAFEDFTRILLGIDTDHPERLITAQLYRAGVANAADRGVDIWANFGPVVQVKHLTLTEEIAEDIVSEFSSAQIVIVCKDGEKETIERILSQLGERVQGIVIQSQLNIWYQRALSSDFNPEFGMDLLESLRIEFQNEFPFSQTFEEFYKERAYDRVPKPDVACPFWVPD